MKSELQKALKAVFDEADALQAKVTAEKRVPTADEQSKMTSLSSKAEELTKSIDNLTVLEQAKAHSEESAGSVVAATFDREVMPEDGEIPGVTMDAKSGEMYAIDGALKSVGERKLKALKSGAYKDGFAEYVRAKGLNRPMSLKGDAMKILNEGSDPSGGFWIPPDFRPELVKKMATMATIRPNASVYVTGTDHITFPTVNYNGSTSDDTYANLFTSGVRFSWRGSVGSTTDFSEATNPIAGQVNIPVQLATASVLVMREQLEDSSFDVLGYITALGAEAFALGEENAYINGTGAGQPRGFLMHPANDCTTASRLAYSTYATVAGTTYWGNTFLSGTTTVAWGSDTAGILGVEAWLPPQYEGNAKWFAAKRTLSAIRALNAGTATLPQWSLGDSWPNFANGYNMSLLGYNVQKSQFMPAAQTGLGYLVLADMSGYYIVDRVGLSVDVNPYIYQNRDQVLIYMRKRTGGDLVHYWKMKVLTST